MLCLRGWWRISSQGQHDHFQPSLYCPTDAQRLACKSSSVVIPFAFRAAIKEALACLSALAFAFSSSVCGFLVLWPLATRAFSRAVLFSSTLDIRCTCFNTSGSPRTAIASCRLSKLGYSKLYVTSCPFGALYVPFFLLVLNVNLLFLGQFKYPIGKSQVENQKKKGKV